MPPRALALRERKGAGTGPAADDAVSGGVVTRPHHIGADVQLGCRWQGHRTRVAGPAESWTSFRRTERNDSATYLAQRTQLGSGNTVEAIPPRDPASLDPNTAAGRYSSGRRPCTRERKHGRKPRRARDKPQPRWSTAVRYLTDAGNSQGVAPNRPDATPRSRTLEPTRSGGRKRTPRH